MNEKYKIYLDMDGVLAAFDQKVEEIFKTHIQSVPKKDLWGGIKRYNDTVEPFFENLEPMPDAMQLWKFCSANFQEVEILTATGHAFQGIGEQKRKWVAQHLNSSVIVHTVRKSEEKALFANPNSILVDDRMKSIAPWRAAGGIGILHTSATQSIRELENFLKS